MFIFGAAHDKYLSKGPEAISQASEILNEKKFRVADTPLSYRVVNALDKKGLIKDEREDGQGWRMFSLKELVFLYLVKEVRMYGLVDIQLEELSESFFNDALKQSTDEAILLVLNGVAIIVSLDASGGAAYYSAPAYDAFTSSEVSHIRINFNEIVMEVWEKLGKKRKEYDTNNSIWAKIIQDFDLTEQEAELMKIIRQEKYSKITVRKNKEKFVVDAEDINQADVSPNEILEMIANGEFTDIEVQKRDGKVVNLKKSDKYKI